MYVVYIEWYEYSYISEAIDKPELQSIIHILKYCSRYIDDLNVPTASDELCEIIINDIYPE